MLRAVVCVPLGLVLMYSSMPQLVAESRGGQDNVSFWKQRISTAHDGVLVRESGRDWKQGGSSSVFVSVTQIALLYLLLFHQLLS
jgi:hypothetical protein